jgi:poly-gamma-glutamate synthesis protein (capsule biosynthesis protein)
MRKILSVSFVFLGFSAATQIPQDSVRDEITLLFLGDIMGHGPQITAAYDSKTGTYNYDHCFRYIKDELSDADYTIGNLEVTLAGPTYSGYPQFSSPDALAEACRDAGMDVLVTANNHTCDRGGDGIIRTVNVLDTLKIMHTGSFLDAADRERDHPLFIENDCFRLAILNYTYGTNGLPFPAPTIVNLLDKEQIKKDMEIAKANNVDKIIVVVHWGDEYKLQPVPYQVDFGNYIFEQGADIIIGAHPHVLEKMVWEKDIDSLGNERLIVYSLGNFVSNQRKRYTDGGALFKMTLRKEGKESFIKDAGYMLTWVYTPTEADGKKYYILPAAKYESDTSFFDSRASYDQMMLFINDSRTLFNAENKNVPEYIYQNEKWALKE